MIYLGLAGYTIFQWWPTQRRTPRQRAAGWLMAASLVLTSGSGQTGPPGEELQDPLVVRVVDEAGNGIPGQAVTWVVATDRRFRHVVRRGRTTTGPAGSSSKTV